MKKYVLRRFRDDNELQKLLGRGTTVEAWETKVIQKYDQGLPHLTPWKLIKRTQNDLGLVFSKLIEAWHDVRMLFWNAAQVQQIIPTQTAKLLISERFSLTGRMDHYCFWMSNGSLAAWVPIRQTVPKAFWSFSSRFEKTCIIHYHATKHERWMGGWMHFQHLNIIHVLFSFIICMLKFLKVATTWGIGYKNYKYFYLFLLYSAMATSVEAAALWHWTCGERGECAMMNEDTCFDGLDFGGLWLDHRFAGYRILRFGGWNMTGWVPTFLMGFTYLRRRCYSLARVMSWHLGPWLVGASCDHTDS